MQGEVTEETDTDTTDQLGAAMGTVEETPWTNWKQTKEEEKKSKKT